MRREYGSLKDVRKTLQIPWYRCPIDAATLKRLTRRSDARGLAQAVGHLVLIALSGYPTYWCFVHHAWAGFCVSLFAFGTVYSFTNHACHELSHGTVFRTRWLNGLFLRIFAVFSWVNFYYVKISHTYHHLYTLYPDGDGEVVLPKHPSLEIPYLLQLISLCIKGGWEAPGLIPVFRSTVRLAFGRPDDEWSAAVLSVDPVSSRRAIWWARFLLLFHGGLLAAGFLSGFWFPPLMLSFGFFLANWLRYFVGMPMHVGLRDNVPDFRLCVRTITLDPISHFLYWRMNYHIEHHMYAAVPCYNLRELSRALASDLPKARTLTGAWREMRETWRRQKTDPEYQYDTPVPARPKNVQGPEDPVGTSLGDLDPSDPA